MKKLWKKSQERAIDIRFSIGRFDVNLYWTWLGVFIWGAVLVWILL